jgi:hypothetical protein
MTTTHNTKTTRLIAAWGVAAAAAMAPALLFAGAGTAHAPMENPMEQLSTYIPLPNPYANNPQCDYVPLGVIFRLGNCGESSTHAR